MLDEIRWSEDDVVGDDFVFYGIRVASSFCNGFSEPFHLSLFGTMDMVGKKGSYTTTLYLIVCFSDRWL